MKKVLPIGITDFQELIQGNYYFIDKTKLIEDMLTFGAKVTLFTRPRRFGKTLNMSMLRYFWDIQNAEENKKLFQGLYIENSFCFAEQGKYPVIYLSLKDMKSTSWEDCLESMKLFIQNLFISIDTFYQNWIFLRKRDFLNM